MIYTPGATDAELWTRQVLGSDFQHGHGMAAADFNGDGFDEVVGGGGQGMMAQYIYRYVPSSGKWDRIELDVGGVAVSGIAVKISTAMAPSTSSRSAAAPRTTSFGTRTRASAPRRAASAAPETDEARPNSLRLRRCFAFGLGPYHLFQRRFASRLDPRPSLPCADLSQGAALVEARWLGDKRRA